MSVTSIEQGERSGPDQSSCRDTIVAIMHEHTLYDTAAIPLEGDLEGELGVDSVLLRSILVDVEERFDLPEASLTAATFVTVREIIDAVDALSAGPEHQEASLKDAAPSPGQDPRPRAALSSAAGSPAVGSPAVGGDPQTHATRDRASASASAFTPGGEMQVDRASDLDALVVDVFRRQTLYDSELALDVQLEGELGIDSLMLESILDEVERVLGLAKGSIRTGTVGTLREVITAAVTALESAVEQQAPPPATLRRRDGRGAQTRSAPAPRPMASEVPSVSEVPGLQTRPHPCAQTADQLDSLVGQVLEVSATNLDPDRPLRLQGISNAAQSRLQQAVRRALGAREHIELEECDTIEKLRTYLHAAAPHSVQPLGTPVPAPAATGGDQLDRRSMKDFVEQRDRDLMAKVRSFNSFYLARKRDQLYWYGMPSESLSRNRVVVYDETVGRRRELLNFASNNYLGLANDPRVIDAIADGAHRFGATNTGCRIIGGTTALHLELERRLARFKKRPACILYPSGYSANLGVISALVKRHDAVILDKFNHMSIVDGAKLSGGQRRIYKHNDMEDLERVLEHASTSVDGKLIVTDGVFSMHGDLCNLPAICALARSYGAYVLVDDAHSTGVLGARGSGTAEHFDMKGDVDLELGTMSKALGGLGGFVAGEEEVVEYLRFYSNSYVFAATIPAPVAAGLIASIDLLESEPERLERLWVNVRHLAQALESGGFDLGGSQSAILPVVVGDDRTALELGRAVRARGMFCQTVVFPGVSVGDARLRISVTSEHTRDDLDLAAAIITEAAREVGFDPRQREPSHVEEAAIDRRHAC